MEAREIRPEEWSTSAFKVDTPQYGVYRFQPSLRGRCTSGFIGFVVLLVLSIVLFDQIQRGENFFDDFFGLIMNFLLLIIGLVFFINGIGVRTRTIDRTRQEVRASFTLLSLKLFNAVWKAESNAGIEVIVKTFDKSQTNEYCVILKNSTNSVRLLLFGRSSEANECAQLIAETLGIEAQLVEPNMNKGLIH